MSAAALLLLTVVLAALAALGRPSLTFGVLLGTVLLLPATILVPSSPSAILTVPRVVELGAIVGVVVAYRRRPLPRRPAWPLVVFVLMAYLAVAAVTGIGLADRLTAPVPAAYAWVGLAEQVVLLVVGMLLVVRIDPARLLLIVAGLAGVACLVGSVEAATGSSWARLVFHGVPSQLSSVQAQLLEHRQGHLRVRGAADFALEYGWFVAALVPFAAAAAAAAARRGRRLVATAAVLLAVALVGVCYLTRTRSALAAVLCIAAVLGVALAPRTRSSLIIGLGILAVTGLAAGPTLASALSPSAGQGSIDVRLARLPQVLSLAADRPLRGIGLTGIQRLGIAGFDSSFVRAYVETGAVASVLLALALLTSLVTVGRGLLVRARLRLGGDDALLALASLTALVALLASASSFDTFGVLGSTRLFWLLCAVGVVAAERLRGPARLPSLRATATVPRLALVVAAIGAGFVVRAATPTHVADTAVFATLDVATEAVADPPGMGRTFVTTVCDAASEIAQPGQSWRVTRCGESGPPGWGTLRVEAGSRAQTQDALVQIARAVYQIPGLQHLRIGRSALGPQTGRPAPAEVAPAVFGVLAAFAVLILPGSDDRRWRPGFTRIGLADASRNRGWRALRVPEVQ